IVPSRKISRVWKRVGLRPREWARGPSSDRAGPVLLSGLAHPTDSCGAAKPGGPCEPGYIEGRDVVFDYYRARIIWIAPIPGAAMAGRVSRDMAARREVNALNSR